MQWCTSRRHTEISERRCVWTPTVAGPHWRARRLGTDAEAHTAKLSLPRGCHPITSITSGIVAHWWPSMASPGEQQAAQATPHHLGPDILAHVVAAVLSYDDDTTRHNVRLACRQLRDLVDADWNYAHIDVGACLRCICLRSAVVCVCAPPRCVIERQQTRSSRANDPERTWTLS